MWVFIDNRPHWASGKRKITGLRKKHRPALKAPFVFVSPFVSAVGDFFFRKRNVLDWKGEGDGCDSWDFYDLSPFTEIGRIFNQTKVLRVNAFFFLNGKPLTLNLVWWTYPCLHSHGSGTWVPARRVACLQFWGPFSTSMMMGGRVSKEYSWWSKSLHFFNKFIPLFHYCGFRTSYGVGFLYFLKKDSCFRFACLAKFALPPLVQRKTSRKRKRVFVWFGKHFPRGYGILLSESGNWSENSPTTWTHKLSRKKLRSSKIE